jgi:hypothetical protein
MFRFVARCSPPGANDLAKQQRVRVRLVHSAAHPTHRHREVGNEQVA